MIDKEKIIKPKTKEEKAYNKSLYRKKDTIITSMLRDHFRELKFSKEQWKWLAGKLRIKAGKFDVRFPIYHNEMLHQGRIKK